MSKEIKPDGWDENADILLTPEQRDELERRLADYEANPNAGSPWEEVLKRLEERFCGHENRENR